MENFCSYLFLEIIFWKIDDLEAVIDVVDVVDVVPEGWGAQPMRQGRTFSLHIPK